MSVGKIADFRYAGEFLLGSYESLRFCLHWPTLLHIIAEIELFSLVARVNPSLDSLNHFLSDVLGVRGQSWSIRGHKSTNPHA